MAKLNFQQPLFMLLFITWYPFLFFRWVVGRTAGSHSLQLCGLCSGWGALVGSSLGPHQGTVLPQPQPPLHAQQCCEYTQHAALREAGCPRLVHRDGHQQQQWGEQLGHEHGVGHGLSGTLQQWHRHAGREHRWDRRRHRALPPPHYLDQAAGQERDHKLGPSGGAARVDAHQWLQCAGGSGRTHECALRRPHQVFDREAESCLLYAPHLHPEHDGAGALRSTALHTAGGERCGGGTLLPSCGEHHASIGWAHLDAEQQ